MQQNNLTITKGVWSCPISVAVFPCYRNFKTFSLTYDKCHIFQLRKPISERIFQQSLAAACCGCDQEHGTGACSGSWLINSKTFFFNMAMVKPPPSTLTSNCLPPAVEMCSIIARCWPGGQTWTEQLYTKRPVADEDGENMDPWSRKKSESDRPIQFSFT